MLESPEGGRRKVGPEQIEFEDLQRRFEAAKEMGRDVEGSYEGAVNTVVRMVRFLESNFENIKERGLNTEIERMRDAIRRADYSTAIRLAESYYQSYYLTSRGDAPETLFEMVLRPEKK